MFMCVHVLLCLCCLLSQLNQLSSSASGRRLAGTDGVVSFVVSPDANSSLSSSAMSSDLVFELLQASNSTNATSAVVSASGTRFICVCWCLALRHSMLMVGVIILQNLISVTAACAKRTVTACESLRQGRSVGLTSPAFHACGNASLFRARTHFALIRTGKNDHP